jgi:serine/threonine-protein kinase
VVGLTEAAAVADIESVGLVAMPTSSSHPSVPNGEVISQSPSGGVQVAPDTTITIVVSTGPQQFILPDVSGDTETDAVNELNALGLVTTVTPEPSAVVAFGLVIRTNPPAGSTMIAGDDVEVVVSSGP